MSLSTADSEEKLLYRLVKSEKWHYFPSLFLLGALLLKSQGEEIVQRMYKEFFILFCLGLCPLL